MVEVPNFEEQLEQHKQWLSGNGGKRIFLGSANLSKHCLNDVNLTLGNLSCANLSDSELQGTVLAHANLLAADLSNTNAAGACFQGAHLTQAKFCGANLRYANFSRVTAYSVDFSGADLTRALFDDAILFYSKFDGAKICWYSGNLVGAILSNSAGEDYEYSAFAALISTKRSRWWASLMMSPTRIKEWAVPVLRRYLRDDDPEYVRMCLS